MGTEMTLDLDHLSKLAEAATAFLIAGLESTPDTRLIELWWKDSPRLKLLPKEVIQELIRLARLGMEKS